MSAADTDRLHGPVQMSAYFAARLEALQAAHGTLAVEHVRSMIDDGLRALPEGPRGVRTVHASLTHSPFMPCDG